MPPASAHGLRLCLVLISGEGYESTCFKIVNGTLGSRDWKVGKMYIAEVGRKLMSLPKGKGYGGYVGTVSRKVGFDLP